MAEKETEMTFENDQKNQKLKSYGLLKNILNSESESEDFNILHTNSSENRVS